jgi:hypothetical protein
MSANPDDSKFKQMLDQARRELQSGKILSMPRPAPRYACEVCRDMGIVTKDIRDVNHPDFGKAFPCPNPDCPTAIENNKRRIANLYGRVALPSGYRELTFQSWIDFLKAEEWEGKRHAFGAAAKFAQRHGQKFSLREAAQMVERDFDDDDLRLGLVLTGINGVGKTGLASAVVNYLIAQDVDVLYIRVQDLIKKIQDSYSASHLKAAVNDMITAACNVSVLILDEWTLDNASDDRKEKMEMIVRARHNDQKPMLITTNTGKKEFRDTWGERIGSPVATMHWLELFGKTLRQYGSDKAIKSF